MAEQGSRLWGMPPRLGLLVDWLEDGYQSAILRGAMDAARERGASLICFTGGVLGSPERDGARRNHIFDLAGAENIDALMVMSGTMGNHVGPAALAEFCERFRPLPMCSIGVPLPDMPCVRVDNAAGMHSALTHLIRTHESRHIAFVRGPAANEEAESRFGVYRAVLAEHAIEFDPNLVTMGDFQPESGALAVKTLLDERGIETSGIDAIVASNDSMAMGVLHALLARDIGVPEQIAVVGFDDVEDVRYTRPPLTTVHQPLYEQGRHAVRMVLTALETHQRVENVVLRTELVVRRSCGCFDAASSSEGTPLTASRHGLEAAIVERRQLILAELTRAARGAFGVAGAGWEIRLLNAFTAEIAQKQHRVFSDAFDQIVLRVLQSEADSELCHEVISAMRRQLLPCLASDHERRARAEDLFQRVRTATSSAIERAEARERLRIERWARTLGETGAALIATFDLREMVSAVSERFPRLGIRGACLALYEGEEAPSAESHLVLAYGISETDDVTGASFKSRKLLPESLAEGRRQHSFVVAPLFFRRQILGFLLLDLEAGQGFALEAMRELFSAALKGAKLVDEVREAEGAAREAASRMRSMEVAFDETHRGVQRLREKVLSARASTRPLSADDLLVWIDACVVPKP